MLQVPEGLPPPQLAWLLSAQAGHQRSRSQHASHPSASRQGWEEVQGKKDSQMLPAAAPFPPPSPTPQRCLVVFTVISHSSIRNFPNWGFFLLFYSNTSLL